MRITTNPTTTASLMNRIAQNSVKISEFCKRDFGKFTDIDKLIANISQAEKIGLDRVGTRAKLVEATDAIAKEVKGMNREEAVKYLCEKTAQDKIDRLSKLATERELELLEEAKEAYVRWLTAHVSGFYSVVEYIRPMESEPEKEKNTKELVEA